MYIQIIVLTHLSRPSVVSFLQPRESSWFSGANWCITSHDGGDCMAVQPPMLHTEQVKLVTGTAVDFVNISTFLLLLLWYDTISLIF